MMSISVNLDDHIELSRIAIRHPELGYSVGVHPCEDATVMARATTEYLVELAQAEKYGRLVKPVSTIFTVRILLLNKRMFRPSYSGFKNSKSQ